MKVFLGGHGGMVALQLSQTELHHLRLALTFREKLNHEIKIAMEGLKDNGGKWNIPKDLADLMDERLSFFGARKRRRKKRRAKAASKRSKSKSKIKKRQSKTRKTSKRKG